MPLRQTIRELNSIGQQSTVLSLNWQIHNSTTQNLYHKTYSDCRIQSH